MVEDVDDHVGIVRHDPLACRVAVDRGRLDAVLGLDLVVDFPRDRFQMRIGGAGADDEKIGEGGDAAEIEDGDVLGFFFGGVVPAKAGELFRFDGVAPGKGDVRR